MGCIFLLTSRWAYNLGVYKLGGGGGRGESTVQLRSN